MTEKVTIDGKAILFWLLLCAGMLDAQAFGLGRMQGTALIGRALDVSVQVQTDPGEDGGALCLDAEVFHADTRQDQRLVRVTLDTVVAGQIANARIFSATPVDEPVVTVLLRAGCAQKTTRRYVLLADPPADVPAPLVPLVAPVASDPAAAPPSIATVATSATATPVSNAAAAALNGQPLAPASLAASANTRAGSLNSATAAELPVPATKPASTAAAPKLAPSTVTTPVAALPERSALPAGPRLTLSPAVPRAERVDKPLTGAPAPALAPASAVVVAPAAALANDATALAAQKIQTLERDITAALARSARLETSLTDMNTRLQQAESQRWPSELLYGLVVLLLACLLSVGWLWTRLRRLQAERGGWWSHSVMNQTDPAADLDQPTASAFAVAAAVSSRPSPVPESVHSVEFQPEPLYPGTDPSQDRAAPLTEPALAAAELSLDLDNLIDFESSQVKKPPVA